MTGVQRSPGASLPGPSPSAVAQEPTHYDNVCDVLSAGKLVRDPAPRVFIRGVVT